MMDKLIKISWITSLVFLVACTSQTDYTHAIPKDASMIIALDSEQMVEKAGLVGSEGEKLTGKLKALLKGGLEGEAAQLAERIIDKPSETGFSFKDKIYLFASPHADFLAFLARVDEESKLENLFEVLEKESIATSLQEESGCRWAQIGSAICAFNNGTFLLIQPSKGDAIHIKGTLFSLMRQKKDEGFSALAEYEKLQEKGDDIVSFVNLSVIPYEYTTPLRMGLSADIRLEDINYLIKTNFEQGRVLIECESLSQNPKVQGFYNVMDNIVQPIQGRLLDYYQGNTMIWTGGNIQGQELYQVLCKNPTIKQALDNPLLPIDVASIFSSIAGDFAIGNMGNKYLLYADVTQSDFLNTFEELRPWLALSGGQITLDKIGKDEYLMRTYYDNFWFGVKNNRLYVTNNHIWADEIGRTYGASMGVKEWAKEVVNNRLFTSVNLKEWSKATSVFGGANRKNYDLFFKTLVNHCDYLNVSIPDFSQVRMELVLREKNANLLQIIANLVEGL